MGIGPGRANEMTPRAEQALKEAEVVVGYRTYLDLVRRLLPGKEVVGSGMREEVARAREAVARAAAGAQVAVVSGGDPGVYGMAAPVLEAAAAAEVPVTVVPGVTAATAAAALLGAPLGHDFAVVSLSDLLTPWSVIEKRLRAVVEADFVLVLYNPASSRRQDKWRRALVVIRERRPPETPVGVVWDAGREGERKVVCNLATVAEFPVDMRALVIIGNSQTYVANGAMITPRGYKW
ncbi:MAG: precorrin-3B C(17)-methyltransferase [Bacillota bacterium]